MSDAVIGVYGLAKRYRIGLAPRATMLREAITQGARAAGRRLAGRRSERGHQWIWALQDVSFEVPRGQAFGIIGGNGAGKSTLLRILSRITEPTEGYARIEGRVGSLLEVGTGFHPELTGRENTYLNGAILGMKRVEIDRRFDEIVDFAGVETFLDTPVKHYSSGMYLRLAFAVAAHLEPEILMVDEVLSVGDAEFQKKCLGKMREVTHGGRTVLFVSHNLEAVQRLCPSTILLESGRLARIGPSRQVISEYLSATLGHPDAGEWIDVSQRPRSGTGEVRFSAVRFEGPDGALPTPCAAVGFSLLLDARAALTVPSLAVVLRDIDGTHLLNADVASTGRSLRLTEGRNAVRLRIEALYLNPGEYMVDLWIGDFVGPGFDHVQSSFVLRVVAAGGATGPLAKQGVVPCEVRVMPFEGEESARVISPVDP